MTIYEANTTNFQTLGLGSLIDVQKGTVVEKRNESIELDFVYPAGGHNADLIIPGRIVTTSANNVDGPQPFRITEVNRSTKGDIKVHGVHLALWYASGAVIGVGTIPGTVETIMQALTIPFVTLQDRIPVRLETDLTGSGSIINQEPRTVLQAIVGTEGSVVDTFGGIIHADGLTIRVERARGADHGVQATEGVNLLSLDMDSSLDRYASAVYAYWLDKATGTNIHTQAGLGAPEGSPRHIVAKDFSQDIKTQPTADQLAAAARAWAKGNLSTEPEVSISASFVPLWDTAEYKGIIAEQPVAVGDTVHVMHYGLGVDQRVKVVATTWDTVAERYTKVELGAITRKLTDLI